MGETDPPGISLSRMRFPLGGRDGIALLMVLVVITILASLVVSFMDTTQKHLQVTQYGKNRLQAYWAAQSGIQAAVAMLKMGFQAQQNVKYDGADSYWHYESEQYQESVPLLLANVFCESSMLEPALLLPETSGPGPEVSLSRAPPAVPILDENRKLSLAKLVKQIGTRKEGTDTKRFDQLAYLLQALLKEADFVAEEERSETAASLGLVEEAQIDIDRARELARYLVDWIDTENNTTADVAYNSDAAELACPADDLPYEAKNGALDSIDEIGLVCGFRRLPRPVIEGLTRHLTVYDLETNINTATPAVLHALCAAKSGEPKETDSERIYRLLHYDGDDESIQVITQKGNYEAVLEGEVEDSLIQELEKYTGVQSTHFRIAVYGVVFNPETGSELARARIRMDLLRKPDNQLDLLYYRED